MYGAQPPSTICGSPPSIYDSNYQADSTNYATCILDYNGNLTRTTQDLDIFGVVLLVGGIVCTVAGFGFGGRRVEERQTTFVAQPSAQSQQILQERKSDQPGTDNQSATAINSAQTSNSFSNVQSTDTISKDSTISNQPVGWNYQRFNLSVFLRTGIALIVIGILFALGTFLGWLYLSYFCADSAVTFCYGFFTASQIANGGLLSTNMPFIFDSILALGFTLVIAGIGLVIFGRTRML